MKTIKIMIIVFGIVGLVCLGVKFTWAARSSTMIPFPILE